MTDLTTVRKDIFKFEEILKQGTHMVGDFCPLRHTFVDGAYVRQCFIPKGTFGTSKIHKITHPFFIMSGDVSVYNSEEEKAIRMKAPYWGVTPANTKRIVFANEDTIWITVHVTQETDLKKIEKEIILESYEAIDEDVKEKLTKEEL